MFQGSLFTRDFLEEGITEARQWREFDDAELEKFGRAVRNIYANFPVEGTANEAQTEDDIILKVLGALGWDQYLRQQTAARKRRTDVPDILLFADAGAKAKANAEQQEADRYKHGLSFVESKAWQLRLDRASEESDGLKEVPSTQMLRYLSLVEVQSNRRIQWGTLANGRHWRLYFQGARSRSEDFLELDLPIIAGIEGIPAGLFTPKPEEQHHWLKIFYLMFRQSAFLPETIDGRTFHGICLDEGKLWEEQVAQDLSEVVFETVFPDLVRGLAAGDPNRPAELDSAYLGELRDAVMTLLYRLLFVLYAEDRNLLPPGDTKYDDYSLRKIRIEIGERCDTDDVLSKDLDNYYQHARNLFRAINNGEPSLGLPPYNGGLFDPVRTPLLERARLPDAVFARAIDSLSRRASKDRPRWINYRDLSVQHLGSIYERLLQYEVVQDDTGGIGIRPNIFARKVTGSFYTHDDLVGLILERAVGPLLDKRLTDFRDKIRELGKLTRPKAERLSQLSDDDPATRMLDIKVCDPAMGSSHFLVSLVDYLADRVLEAVAEAEQSVPWADEDAPYVSPLTDRIGAIRARILDQAKKQSWVIDESQLDDRHIVRRMILKRVIYGVDKNPMAVELAKVSLWLHTFTVGAPLSFLDHHLRTGNSLFGEWIRPVEDELHKRYSLLIRRNVAQAKNAAKGMGIIEEKTDADIAEVRASSETFAGVTRDTEPLSKFFDFYHALRWSEPRSSDDKAEHALDALFDGSFGDPFQVISGRVKLAADEVEESRRELFQLEPEQFKLLAKRRGETESLPEAQRLLSDARALAEEEEFFHWEVAFPGVWGDWKSKTPRGGFDAVIGNPPWDRIKLQEVEWFEARKTEIAHAQRAADRKRMIQELRKHEDPLWRDYEKARDRAKAAAHVARASGEYPLLSHGDINIYALFVERAHRLVRPEGIVGLLLPSGIASDKSASKFFQTIATKGRLAALLDFENRRIDKPHFFPDVDSRFKFCVYVAGNEAGRFDKAECAFFLHDVAELKEPGRAFTLDAADFEAVNPNTGTAPVFRTKRDAEITTAIYRRVPVLVDRREDPPKKVWPVRYVRMFDMTNDSHLFKTREELLQEGAYPVAGNRLKRGESEYVPLYRGRTIYQFDHRAASVQYNPNSLHNPFVTVETTVTEHQKPEFAPGPHFWVATSEVEWPEDLRWCIAFRDIARVTDARTVIAAAVPYCGAGNTLPLLVPVLSDARRVESVGAARSTSRRTADDAIHAYLSYASLLLANLNSLVLDYIARQKVQSTHLNWYIVEQLPVLLEEVYSHNFGKRDAGSLVREEVLKLTYTAHDIEPFARDMGYDGPPFIWDEDDRRHSRARLDALFFLLYGIDRDDAAYILDTFPIVRKRDEKAFGRYVSKELTLAYMSAFEAGDTESRISL